MHAGCWPGRHARRAFKLYGAYGGWGGCGPHAWERPTDEGAEGWGGGHGVRRPLRFLVYKLGLDDRQSAELARILNELKTERAQTAVDYRRAVSAFADALAGGAFDHGKAGEGGALRVQSAERLRIAVLKALEQIHAVLNPEQRERLAYLIRTGALSL
jgi:Spy/CpxP family protein refolding chaperone